MAPASVLGHKDLVQLLQKGSMDLWAAPDQLLWSVMVTHCSCKALTFVALACQLVVPSLLHVA